MKIKITFEEFLAEKHCEQNPEILDDNLPDAFDDWLTYIDVQDIIDYGDEYANKIIMQVKKDLIRK